MKKFFFSALICSLLTMPVFAQDNCDPAFDPNCTDPDNQIPLDGAAVILLGLTGLYGVQKLRSSYKKESL